VLTYRTGVPKVLIVTYTVEEILGLIVIEDIAQLQGDVMEDILLLARVTLQNFPLSSPRYKTVDEESIASADTKTSPS